MRPPTARGVPLLWPSRRRSAEKSSGLCRRERRRAGHARGARAAHWAARACSSAAPAAPSDAAKVRWTLSVPGSQQRIFRRRRGGRQSRRRYLCRNICGQRQFGPGRYRGRRRRRSQRLCARRRPISNRSTFDFACGRGGLNGDTVRFRLTTRGGAEALQHALALNGRLQPMRRRRERDSALPIASVERRVRWLRQIPNLISSIRILLVVPIAVALLHHQLHDDPRACSASPPYPTRPMAFSPSASAGRPRSAQCSIRPPTSCCWRRCSSRWRAAADTAVVDGGGAGARHHHRARRRRLPVCYGPIEVRPSIVSKLNTLCQVAFILAIIGREEFSMPPACGGGAARRLMFVTIVVSGIDYVLVYGRRALQEAKSRRAAARAAGSKLT